LALAAMSRTEPAREADDAALVARARSGADRDAAFAALYERYKDEVFAFLVRFLGDRALAEDVHQEAFVRVHLGLGSFDAARPFRPWLHQIVRNAAIDALRARRKEKRAVEGVEARVATAPEDELERRERIERARDAFDALPDETRSVLFQRHGLGLSLEELAAAWSCTERTVRNRLRAAAGELAALLARRRGGS